MSVRYTLPSALKGTMLEEICRDRLQDLAGTMEALPAESLLAVLDRAPAIRPFRTALSRRRPAVIAELKKASPSRGVIREAFDPLALGLQYQDSGAAAISVLTEMRHFQGSLEILAELRCNTRLPLLRKDFLLDPYQVLEARFAGADAVLLIAALLEDRALRNLRQQAENLGMEALVEVHDETELARALDSGATLVGVNNRDLGTFEVSLETSLRLAPRIPRGVVAVSESGIRNGADIRRLADAGYAAFLVGEQLMRSGSPGKALRELMGL